MADKNHIFSHLSLSTTDRSPSVCLIVVFFHLPEVVFTSIPERLWWRGISVLAMTWQFVMVKWNTPCKNRILSHPNWCSSVFLTFCRQQYYWNWMEQIMKCGETWVPEHIQDASNQTWFNPAPDTGSQESGVSDRHTNRRGNLRSVFAALATCSNIVLPIEECYGNYWMV